MMVLIKVLNNIKRYLFMDKIETLFTFKSINNCKICGMSLFESDIKLRSVIYTSLNLSINGMPTCGRCAEKYINLKRINNIFNREVGYHI